MLEAGLLCPSRAQNPTPRQDNPEGERQTQLAFPLFLTHFWSLNRISYGICGAQREMEMLGPLLES